MSPEDRSLLEGALGYIIHVGANHTMRGQPHPQQWIVDGLTKILRASQSEAVQRDTARLDAVQRMRATIYRSEVGHWVCVDETKRDRLGNIGKDVRDAIDKASPSDTEEKK